MVLHLGSSARPLAAAALALGAMAASACTGCGEQLAPVPALDGSGAAAGHAATTSSTTSSPSSSGGGGSYPSPFPGWEPLAGVPAYCQVYAASEPATLPPLGWLPCADGTPGCLELKIDWETPPGNYVFYPGAFAGAATAAGPVVAMSRRLGGTLAGWYELLVGQADGLLLMGMRSRDHLEGDVPCSAVEPAVGMSRVVAAIVDWSLEYPDYIEHELEVPLSGGVPTVFSTLSVETLHGNIGANRSPGPFFMAMGLSPGGHLLTVPYDGSPPTVFAKFTLEHPWIPTYPVTVGTHVVFWADESPRTREHVYHSGTGVTEALIEVPGVDVSRGLSDGSTLVWLQVWPPKAVGPPSTVELWSSPLVTSPAALAPQKIADLGPPLWNDEAYFESGLVVLRDHSWSRDIVLRLSDRVYWTVDAPAGSWWGSTLYATPDEIAMPVQPPYYAGETFTIRRQKLADLGAPKPLQGLLGE